MTKREYLINNIDVLAFQICERTLNCGNCPLDYLDCCINAPETFEDVSEELDEEVEDEDI